MFLPRIIPVLLLKDKGLVKTVKFRNPRYIGDPINAVKIFNDLKADELVFLDITATKEKRHIDMGLVRDISAEAYMPFAVGGGITDLKTVEQLLSLGCEKVIVNSAFFGSENLIGQIVSNFGSQSLILSVDVKKSFFGRYEIFSHSGTLKQKDGLLDVITKANDLEVGEVLINSIDNDGRMVGYDLNLIKIVAQKAKCPTIACGGAASLKDFYNAIHDGDAHSVAAGSLFVYHGPRKAVLINYPAKEEITEIIKSKEQEIGI